MNYKEFLVPILLFIVGGISISLIAFILEKNIWAEAILISLILGFMISILLVIIEKM